MLQSVTATVLDTAVYGMWQVDNLLGLRSGTAQRWIDGYDRRGHQYKPVIREERTGSEIVTWGEFVEASLLAKFRSSDVPMVRMRPVVEKLRPELDTPYPLAAARLWLFVRGGELVRRVQEEVDLEPELRLVEVVRTGQMAYATPERGSRPRPRFTRPVRDFLDQVDFHDNVAARIYPLGKGSAVALDPVRAFGAPAVRAVRTDVIAEERRAGESIKSIAASYGLTTAEVKDAIKFEDRLKAA
jgi:uncharacterized protein (DUF433 family)